MSNVLVVTGSARPNSANEKVVPLVVNEIENQGSVAILADLKMLDMPFFDAPFPPSAPEFEPTNPAVVAWTGLVEQADGVVFVTPEYNNNLSPIQMNAIDWIGREWKDKPVALVGYGWTSGAGRAHAAARESLEINLGAKVGDMQANLYFMKDLNPDGTVADAESVAAKISATISQLLSI